MKASNTIVTITNDKQIKKYFLKASVLTACAVIMLASYGKNGTTSPVTNSNNTQDDNVSRTITSVAYNAKSNPVAGVRLSNHLRHPRKL